jgi:hydrogenase maturation protease
MKVLVLGLGNLLCGDDGLGPAVVAQMARDGGCDGVDVLDGGTLGLALLPLLADADVAVLVDAVRNGDAAPGTLLRIDGEAVLPAVRERLSVHQIGVADLLDAARLTGHYPPELVLLGLVPESLELGIGLSDAVQRNVPALIEAIRAELGALVRPSSGHEVLLPAPCDPTHTPV